MTHPQQQLIDRAKVLAAEFMDDGSPSGPDQWRTVSIAEIEELVLAALSAGAVPQGLAQRIDLGMRLGKILGPTYDGASLEEIATRLAAFEAGAVPQQEPQEVESLTFAAFSALNRRRCEDPQGFGHAMQSWSTSDWFVAVIGELGEAANVVKKLNRYRDGVRGNKESEAVLRAKLRAELADAFIYLDLIFQACGFVTVNAVVDTFDAKSAEIGYPHQLRSGAVPSLPAPQEQDRTKI